MDWRCPRRAQETGETVVFPEGDMHVEIFLVRSGWIERVANGGCFAFAG